MECSCRLWPTPGMYGVTSTPPVSRTRQTLRSAEFGFLGVVVYTRVHTPRRCGEPFSAGVLVFSRLVLRPLRTSCAMVGILLLFLFLKPSTQQPVARPHSLCSPQHHGTGRCVRASLARWPTVLA